MGKQDYLPVSKARRSASFSNLIKSQAIFTKVSCLQIFICIFMFGIIFGLNDFRTEEIAKLRNQINVMDSKISELKISNGKSIKTTKSQALEVSKINNILSHSADSSFDSSDVGLAVFENMQNFYLKNTQRWVAPCNWSHCRHQTLPIVLQHVLQKMLNAAVLQIGSANQAIVKAKKMSPNFPLFEQATFVCSESYFKRIKNNFKQSNLEFVEFSSDSVQHLEPESFDIVYLNLFSLTDIDSSSKILQRAYKTLKVGGTLIGLGYAAMTPNLEELTDYKFPAFWDSADKNGLPTHMLDVKLMNDVKALVDDFTLASTKDVTGTGGLVNLAGDSVWFLNKRKVTFKDLFGNS